ncbi:unnamed protein product [Spirodela intermedia]|uniref:DUF4378 domain-containing protein n=1 Tax=Spirodela intermedia TaxID=51605 RepID=A0A7I8IHK9_SPIIN|nr:unnamed protein product [Spirodela intermedia]CAA6657361.1 unnamed protein product [Spirodela intermedia]
MVGLVQQNDDQLSEISVNNLNRRPLDYETSLRRTESNGQLASILIQREHPSPPAKDVHEDVSVEFSTSRLEQPSPVSVLDAAFYKDDLPASPIKKALSSSRAEDPQNDHHVPGRGIWKPAGPDSRQLPNNPASDSSSPAYHKTIKSIDNLLQKLWWLTLSKDDDDDDENSPAAAPTSLIEVKNPDHRYVYEMLMASGLLGMGSDDGPALPTRLHKSGCVMDPGLFLLLEQRHRSRSQGEKLRRRLLFDAVNEMLARKVESAGLVQSRPVHGGAQLLKELCMEIDRLTAHRGGAASSDDEEDDALKPIVCEHMVQQSEGWADFGKEASGLVLDLERSIFKDLIGELVNGEVATALSLPARLSRSLFR